MKCVATSIHITVRCTPKVGELLKKIFGGTVTTASKLDGPITTKVKGIFGGIPLTKIGLLAAYINKYPAKAASSPGSLHRDAGLAFEKTFLRHAHEEGYALVNTNKYSSEFRAKKTKGKYKGFIPDGVGSSNTVEIRGTKTIISSTPGTQFFEVTDFWEVKASNQKITLSYNKYQIQSMINYLSKFGATNRPTLTLITTSDVEVSKQVLEYATHKNVRIKQIKAFINTDGDIGFSSPNWLNGTNMIPKFTPPLFKYYKLEN